MKSNLLIDGFLDHFYRIGQQDARLLEIYCANKRAMSQEELGSALEYVLHRIEKDDPLACVLACRFYINGWGCQLSLGEARNFVDKLVALDTAAGHALKGEILIMAKDSFEIRKEALHCYALALDKGFAAAGSSALLLCLELALESGCNVAQCIGYGIRGAELGHRSSAYEVAVCYEEGRGVEPDACEAVRWYRLASDLGCFFASMRLRRAFDGGQLGLPVDHNAADEYGARFDQQTQV